MATAPAAKPDVARVIDPSAEPPVRLPFNREFANQMKAALDRAMDTIPELAGAMIVAEWQAGIVADHGLWLGRAEKGCDDVHPRHIDRVYGILPSVVKMLDTVLGASIGGKNLIMQSWSQEKTVLMQEIATLRGQLDALTPADAPADAPPTSQPAPPRI